MRTKKIMILVVIVAAFTLPTMAQNYSAPTQQTNMGFRSTSTMMGSGSAYASNPCLNSGGRAYAPSAPGGIGGPLRTGEGPDIEIVVPPIVDVPDPEALVPLGNEILPLMLCAIVYAAWIAIKRRRKANS